MAVHHSTISIGSNVLSLSQDNTHAELAPPSMLIDSTGTELTVMWAGAETYSTGSITVKTTPVIGQTERRAIVTVGSPVSGNGTANHVYSLQSAVSGTAGLGKPVNSGETVYANIPSGFVSGGASFDLAPVTNNSTNQCLPRCRIISRSKHTHVTTYTLEVEADINYGDIGSVTWVASDGVDQVTGTITTHSASSYDGWSCYVASISLSSLDDGPITITATANSNSGLGSRSESITIYNNTGGGLDASTATYYVAASGSDSNDGSVGSPFLTIGKAIIAARVASKATCTIILNEAGTYDPRAGRDGNNFTNTRPVRVTRGGGLTQAQAVIRGGASGLRPDLIGYINYDGVTINISSTASEQDVSAMYGGPLCDDCRITHNDIIDPSLPGSVRLWVQSAATDAEFWGCTIEKGRSGPSNFRLCRNCDMNDLGGDLFNYIYGAAINNRFRRRGNGVPAFAIQYTNAGPATVAKTGSHAAGSLVLVDPVNGTTTLDLTSASYDTMSELVAAIDALTGWTCTASAAGNKLDADSIYPFSAVDATSEIDIYFQSGDHSDCVQVFGASPTWQNRMISGLFEAAPLDISDKPGLTDDHQIFWFDHAGPPVYEGFSVKFVSAPTFTASNVVRSAFHSQANNILIAWNNSPHTKMSLMYGGGGTANSELSVTNFVFAYNAVRQLNREGGSGAGEDCFIVSNHYATDGNVLGDDSTEAVMADQFVNLSIGSLDMTPDAAGVLVDRVPSAVVCANRPASGAIGALNEA